MYKLRANGVFPDSAFMTTQTMPDLRAPPRELLREQVLNRLRDAIIQGWYPPGSRLKERELCEVLGVSRTSVREVLRQLESEQLITVENRRGPFVSIISVGEAKELYETRAIIESALVKNFIDRASDEHFAVISTSVEDYAKAAADQNRVELLGSMSRFYDTLLEGAGNSVLHGVMRQLLARIAFLRNTSLSEPGRLKHSVAEMQELGASILERDVKRAVKAAMNHIAEAEKAALRQLAHARAESELKRA